jgi:hypothetical protein
MNIQSRTRVFAVVAQEFECEIFAFGLRSKISRACDYVVAMYVYLHIFWGTMHAHLHRACKNRASLMAYRFRKTNHLG